MDTTRTVSWTPHRWINILTMKIPDEKNEAIHAKQFDDSKGITRAINQRI
jgi:hypothetical protein